ncbi:MAG: hypothetical protein JWN98_222 [Abditibacteriota bacterium]|nr:hypothetical protein [Abditibacteriota bacterium]
MRITHAWSAETASIGVEGLTSMVRVLHVTDAHIALIDERDAEHIESCRQRCQHWGNVRWDNDSSSQGIATHHSFAEIMNDAAELNLDLIALTGDIIDFPSQASIESAAASIANARARTLYTSGNHDWHFPNLQGREELREAWWPRLQPLLDGHAACQRHTIGGIQFLSFDNSTYQVDEEQLAFARQHLQSGIPSVVLLHIPLSVPTLRAPTLARWQAPILIADPDWDRESRHRWETSEDSATTIEFARTVTTSEDLVAVLCGHIHFPQVDSLSNRAAQYVGAPAFAGSKRLVEFYPLPV